MIKVKTETIYTLTCSHCNNEIKVSKFERKIDGWNIDSTTFPITINTIIDIKCPDCIKKEYDALYSSKKMTDRIKTDYYDKNYGIFINDLVVEFGLEDHPKINCFRQLVYQYEESFINKYYYAQDLAELM